MPGETDLATLLSQMKPSLNEGGYVFCSVDKIDGLHLSKAIGIFREKEGVTLVINKVLADELDLSYELIYSWITLSVHSSLEAVGLTAAFSAALTNVGISCNVIAAFYHDHIFVAQKDSDKAMRVLESLSAADKAL